MFVTLHATTKLLNVVLIKFAWLVNVCLLQKKHKNAASNSSAARKVDGANLSNHV